jgi:LysM repeat protein
MKKLPKVFQNLKSLIISKLFWGRNSLYKQVVHISIFVVAFVVFFSGIMNRLGTNSGSAVLGVDTNSDILVAGASVEAVDAYNGGSRVKSYTVKDGDTLASIAEANKLKEDTLRWANIKLIGPFSKKLETGWQLVIPYTDGVLYTIQSGDTIYSIASKLKSDVFAISEINNIAEPEYKLAVGENIMVPDARLQDWSGIVTVTEDNLVGAFDDPLSNPACSGYLFFGGINSYPGHNGVDLVYPGGCPIRSIAAGTVYYAGWEDISGYTVKVDHGGGVKSYYYHGNGEIWVKSGQYVKQGDDLMMMGCTGNCFGTHLHLTIRLNNQIIDPVAYLPLIIK